MHPSPGKGERGIPVALSQKISPRCPAAAVNRGWFSELTCCALISFEKRVIKMKSMGTHMNGRPELGRGGLLHLSENRATAVLQSFRTAHTKVCYIVHATQVNCFFVCGLSRICHLERLAESTHRRFSRRGGPPPTIASEPRTKPPCPPKPR